MDSSDTVKKLTFIRTKIANRELKEAIEGIRELAAERQSWSLSQQLNELENNYRYMLHYFMAGNKDPEQKNIYRNLIRDLYTLADDTASEILLRESGSLFFEKMRFMQLHAPITLDEQREDIARDADTHSFIGLLEEGPEKEQRLRDNRSSYEKRLQELFYTIFASPRADAETSAALKQFTQDERMPVTAKRLFVSALTMNLLQLFDAPKAELLLDLCRDPEPEVATHAIVGIIPLLQLNSERWSLYPGIESRLKLFADDKVFSRRFMTAVTGYIQAHETEKITRRLTEEILPEMMKLSPMIGKKIRFDEWMGESGLDEKNPEWQKLLEESGLNDKLQEFSNLQMEGADVFHSTFSNLKSYPFFHEMSNWFLPFESQHSSLNMLFSDRKEDLSLINTLTSSSMMCSSDKYSFCFSLMMMPEQFRHLLMSQLTGQEEELQKLNEEEQVMNPHRKEETLIGHYITDLYRFFKLFRRHNEFTDIFNLPLNYHELEPFIPVVRQTANLEKIALYYFEKNNFTEALSAYSLLAEDGSSKSEVWQKIGYCRQMLTDVRGALQAYLHAELLEEGNSWVLHRIASCYRMLKEPESALTYYRRLEQLRPDDLNLQLQIGHCHLELKQYEKALNDYFKVELLDSSNTRAWRSIAWCAFLSRKFDVAHNYYERILAQKPNAHDYLNAGHVELCLGNNGDTVTLYGRSQELAGSHDKFRDMLAEDEEELQEAGVDTTILPVILDGMRYGKEL
ncbi:tetratricopeptide repeat protein [Dysgonomonadaceae bacterium zrk40]|nr:tetratricopeptide repeat protein [Dysgonomonadaceae bacterium zrk40]